MLIIIPRMLETGQGAAQGLRREANSHVPNDSNDFDDGEHEFGLAIATDAKEVDHDDQEQEDRHPRGVRDIRVPKTSGNGSSYNF
jgi:hypothetical protein